MLLWGAGILRAGAFPPALLGASALAATTVGRYAAGLNLAAALGWLACEAALAGAGPRDGVNPHLIAGLLTSSRFGHVWLVHMAIAAALMLATRGNRPKTMAALAGLNLGSLALTGHAVLPTGLLGVLHQSLSVLHLLAAGFWVGGLAVILPLLSASAWKDEATSVLIRFSRWGHWAVAFSFATGLGKAVLILTSRSRFEPAGDYLSLLAVKVGVVLLMTGLALVNRYRVVPRLGTQKRDLALRHLRIGTIAELLLVAVVLGLVSVFASWSPFAIG